MWMANFTPRLKKSRAARHCAGRSAIKIYTKTRNAKEAKGVWSAKGARKAAKNAKGVLGGDEDLGGSGMGGFHPPVGEVGGANCLLSMARVLHGQFSIHPESHGPPGGSGNTYWQVWGRLRGR